MGPTSTWGRAGVGKGRIPPAGSGGRPNQSGNDIPAGQAHVNRSNDKPEASGLLPHEQRARDLMMERTAKAQQLYQAQQAKHAQQARQASHTQPRPIIIPTGPGPQSTRAGRPIPVQRTQQEVIEEARRALGREKARERQIAAGGPLPSDAPVPSGMSWVTRLHLNHPKRRKIRPDGSS